MALALTLMAGFGGCGPGAAGSGTGETLVTGGAVFGATAAPVCTSDIASTLACFKFDGSAAATTLAEGSLVVQFVDSTDASTVTVKFAANGVELDVRCRQLHFSGEWGITAANDARFFGVLTTGQGQPVEPASLQVDTVPGQAVPTLRLTMRSVDGRVVYGPVQVQRLPQPQPLPQPASC